MISFFVVESTIVFIIQFWTYSTGPSIFNKTEFELFIFKTRGTVRVFNEESC